MSYYGKDGKIYYDYNEYAKANKLWEQQEKQTRLLEEQNQLIRENEYKRSEDERARRELEREKLETEKEMEWMKIKSDREIEDSRQKHDKEMRLLKLCDDVGISKKNIDSYISYVSKSNNTFALENKDEKVNNILSELNELEEKMYEHFKDKKEISNDKVEKVKEFKRLIKGDLTFFRAGEKLNNIENNEIKEMYINNKKMFKIGAILEVIGFSILFLLYLALQSTNEEKEIPGELIFFLVGITMATAVGFMICYLINNKKIREKCDEEIKKLESDVNKSKKKSELQQSLQEEKRENLKKTIDKLKKSIKDKHVEIRNEINNEIMSSEKKKLSKFYDFRINHYNPKIEKLLLDLGFDVMYDNRFKSINKSESKKNGEIDEYIEFFSKEINSEKEITFSKDVNDSEIIKFENEFKNIKEEWSKTKNIKVIIKEDETKIEEKESNEDDDPAGIDYN